MGENIYRFQDFYIPERMMGGIQRYIEQGIEPGSFLSAIICNDLKGACAQADDENLRNIPAYIAYFYNESPMSCWGSWKIMERWMSIKNETGR